MQQKKIKIDVVSDVACPWCYVGKKRLERALEQWQGPDVDVEWHPYQLDPYMPLEGLDRTTYLGNKFGSVERVQPMLDQLQLAGEEEGIQFNFGNRWLAVNTLALHQLLHVAKKEGFGTALKARFLKAYFEENLHLNQTEVLYKIMASFGWEAQKTDTVLADDTIAYQVKQEISHYQKLGVSGVPFFIINNKYAISGAQPPEAFLQALTDLEPTSALKLGESCDPESQSC